MDLFDGSSPHADSEAPSFTCSGATSHDFCAPKPLPEYVDGAILVSIGYLHTVLSDGSEEIGVDYSSLFDGSSLHTVSAWYDALPLTARLDPAIARFFAQVRAIADSLVLDANHITTPAT